MRDILRLENACATQEYDLGLIGGTVRRAAKRVHTAVKDVVSNKPLTLPNTYTFGLRPFLIGTWRRFYLPIYLPTEPWLKINARAPSRLAVIALVFSFSCPCLLSPENTPSPQPQVIKQ